MTAPADARRQGGNVLVTSAAAKVPLVRALKTAARRLDASMKVVAGDMDAQALTAFVADDFWQMPTTRPENADALIEGCQARGIRTVLPTRDGELAFWAGQADRFAAAGIAVIVSPLASVEKCLDKLAFARFGEENALPFIPASMAPEGNGPFVVKERFGAGSKSIGLGLDRAAALAHGATLEAPIYQPLITGQEISVDAWLARDHSLKGMVMRRRDRVVNGESQVTTTFRDAALEAQIAPVLQALKLRGPVVLQAMVDEAGRVHVIECNSRFGGASTTAIAAGLDVFYWSLLQAQGQDPALFPFHRIKGELRQIRLPQDIYQHDLQPE